MKATKSKPWVDSETGIKVWRCADGCRCITANDGTLRCTMPESDWYRTHYADEKPGMYSAIERYLEQENA